MQVIICFLLFLVFWQCQDEAGTIVICGVKCEFTTEKASNPTAERQPHTKSFIKVIEFCELCEDALLFAFRYTRPSIANSEVYVMFILLVTFNGNVSFPCEFIGVM